MTREEILIKGKQMREDYEKNNKPAPENVRGIPMELPVGDEKVYCLHYPSKTRKNGPVFINIHGGGFLWGYPEEDDLLCAHMSDVLDIEIYSIEYPKTPENMFPAAVDSVYETVKYLVSHAAEYNFDPNQVSVGGHSAGGNMTAGLAIRNNKDKAFSLKCQVLDYPAIDMRKGALTQDMFKDGDILSIELMDFFYDAYVKPEDENNVLCNPVLATREELTGLPPAVIMTCGNDVLRFQGRQYAQMLMDADVPVMLFEYPKVTHAFDVFPGPDMERGQDYLIHGLRFFMGI